MVLTARDGRLELLTIRGMMEHLTGDDKAALGDYQSVLDAAKGPLVLTKEESGQKAGAGVDKREYLQNLARDQVRSLVPQSPAMSEPAK